MSPNPEAVGITSCELDLDAARALVVRLVAAVAPDLDVASIEWSDSLLDVGDIDSLDFVRMVALTAETTGILVVPSDYARLATLDGFVRYLMERHVRQ